jgi:hypothetical protein
MLIRAKRTHKDAICSRHHHDPSRRAFMRRGVTAGVATLVLSRATVENAMAALPPSCPQPVLAKGALAQIFSEGGPTMGARFIGDDQASSMNATMAANYGISGQANLVSIGNLRVDKTSPFGATLLQGPPGYTNAQWQAVLARVSGGGHRGQFNQDDGAGVDTGLLGGASPFKASQIGKDIRINNANKLALWAKGLPSSLVKGNLSPAALAKVFSLTPAAAGLTNASAMTASADAASALGQILSRVLGLDKRKGASNVLLATSCGFYGSSALADPSYGLNLFTPANVPALAGIAGATTSTDAGGNTITNTFSTQELALLAGFYQSAAGVAGGVFIEYSGRDYHGEDPQTVIAPRDIEEARAIVMFLAACDAAQSRGAMIYLSNGQAIAAGTQQTTNTIGGNSMTLNTPIADGDAGGSYNAGLILLYDPAGSPPAARFTGRVDANGNVKIDPKIASSKDAVAGLYLSALQHIGADMGKATAVMQKVAIASNPSDLMLF